MLFLLTKNSISNKKKKVAFSIQWRKFTAFCFHKLYRVPLLSFPCY